MKNYILLLVTTLGLKACSSPKYDNPHILILTQYGNIELELFPKKAPKSVAAFLGYIDSGYYQSSSFYRVLNEENQPMGAAEVALIQGGLWEGNKNISLPGIPHEGTNITGLLHTDGTLSLARKEPGTATTEFFICIGDQAGFNYGGSNNGDGQGYAAFGKVVEGMNVIRDIHRQPVEGELFTNKILIKDIKRL